MNDFDSDFDGDIQRRLSSTSQGLSPKTHRLDAVQAKGQRRQTRQRVGVSTAAVVAFLGLGAAVGSLAGLFDQNQVIESAAGAALPGDDDATAAETVDGDGVPTTEVEVARVEDDISTTTGPPEPDDDSFTTLDGVETDGDTNSDTDNDVVTTIGVGQGSGDSIQDETDTTSPVGETPTTLVDDSPTDTTLPPTVTIDGPDDVPTTTALTTTTVGPATSAVPVTMGPPPDAITIATGRPGATFTQWNSGEAGGYVECYQYNANVMYEGCVPSIGDGGLPFIVDRSHTPDVLVVLAMLPPNNVAEMSVESADGTVVTGSVSGDFWMADMPASARPVKVIYVDAFGRVTEDALPVDASRAIATRILIGRPTVLG